MKKDKAVADKPTVDEFDLQGLKNPPPNHNPLIGLLHVDTLQNVHDALELLEFSVTTSEEGFPNSSMQDGYYCLMRCVKDAIKFEINYRPSGQGKSE